MNKTLNYYFKLGHTFIRLVEDNFSIGPTTGVAERSLPKKSFSSLKGVPSGFSNGNPVS